MRNHEEDWDEELSHPQKSSQKIKVSLVKVTLSHAFVLHPIQISTKQGDIPHHQISQKITHCTVRIQGSRQKDKEALHFLGESRTKSKVRKALDLTKKFTTGLSFIDGQVHDPLQGVSGSVKTYFFRLIAEFQMS